MRRPPLFPPSFALPLALNAASPLRPPRSGWVNARGAFHRVRPPPEVGGEGGYRGFMEVF